MKRSEEREEIWVDWYVDGVPQAPRRIPRQYVYRKKDGTEVVRWLGKFKPAQRDARGVLHVVATAKTIRLVPLLNLLLAGAGGVTRPASSARSRRKR